MDTLLLDTSTWDLTTDTSGNLATVGDADRDATNGGALRLAQDVAARVSSWRGEVYYDTTQGIPYDTILGEYPNLVVLQQLYSEEALNVPGCAAALPELTYDRAGRLLGGTINVSDISGNPAVVTL